MPRCRVQRPRGFQSGRWWPQGLAANLRDTEQTHVSSLLSTASPCVITNSLIISSFRYTNTPKSWSIARACRIREAPISEHMAADSEAQYTPMITNGGHTFIFWNTAKSLISNTLRERGRKTKKCLLEQQQQNFLLKMFWAVWCQSIIEPFQLKLAVEQSCKLHNESENNKSKTWQSCAIIVVVVVFEVAQARPWNS